MKEKFRIFEKHIDHNDKNVLSMGGLEVILNNNCEVNFFDFIERNFVSKKVVYGWSSNNSEAYNNLNLQTEFLIKMVYLRKSLMFMTLIMTHFHPKSLMQ